MIAASLAVFGAMLFAGCLYAAIDWWVWRDFDDEEPAAPGEADSPFASPGADPAPADLKPFASDLGIAFGLSGSVNHAHTAFMRAPFAMLVGGWIMSILDWNSNGSGSSDSGDSSTSIDYGALLPSARATIAQTEPDLDFTDPTTLGLMIGIFAFVFVCWGLMILVRAWVTPGWIRLHQSAIVEGTGGFSTLFGGMDRFGAILVWRFLRGLVLAPLLLLVGAPMIAAALQEYLVGYNEFETALLFAAGGGFLAFLLFIWIGPTLMLAEHFISLDDDGPLTALKRSWRAAHGNRVTLIVFYIAWNFLNALILLLGVLALCVGVLVAIPYGRALLDLAWCRAWLLARHGSEAALDWADAAA